MPFKSIFLYGTGKVAMSAHYFFLTTDKFSFFSSVICYFYINKFKSDIQALVKSQLVLVA